MRKNKYYKIYFFFIVYKRWIKQLHEKRKFHHRKNLIMLKDEDIDNIQGSRMFSSSERNINILLVTKIMII